MKRVLSFSLIVLITFQLTGCTNSVKNNIAATQATIAESNGACLNEFATLKIVDPETYKYYLAQFDQLNGTYQVYKHNAKMMNKDAQEMLGMELESKLKLVCARVQSATFQNMTKRAQEINKL